MAPGAVALRPAAVAFALAVAVLASADERVRVMVAAAGGGVPSALATVAALPPRCRLAAGAGWPPSAMELCDVRLPPAGPAWSQRVREEGTKNCADMRDSEACLLRGARYGRLAGGAYRVWSILAEGACAGVTWLAVQQQDARAGTLLNGHRMSVICGKWALTVSPAAVGGCGRRLLSLLLLLLFWL